MAERGTGGPADSPRWDLRRLYANDAAARTEGAEIIADLRSFRSTHATVFTGAAEAAAHALEKLARLRRRMAPLAAYGAARFVTALSEPAANDVSETIDAVAEQLQDVIELALQQWRHLDPERTTALLQTAALRPYAGVLAGARDTRSPLTERETRMLAAREPLVDAWVDLYDRVTAQLSVEVDGTRLTLDEALSRGRSADAAERRNATTAVHDALARESGILAHALDTVVTDRLVVDELTGRLEPGDRPGTGPDDDQGGLPAPAVDAALAAVEANAEIAHRWFAAAAGTSGRDDVDYADLGAPGPADRNTYSFAQARDAILDALGHFDPGMRAAAELTFDGRVHATIDPDKVGNSLCISAGPEPALVLVNFGGALADVITLAHELGHAVHYTLAGRAQGGLTPDPGVLLGEVAAIVTELLVYAELLRHAEPGPARTAIYTARADSLVSTVYRQAALSRFEQDLYAARAGNEVLLPERLAELWLRRMRLLHGPAVPVPERYGCGWALVPHFIRSRYYNRNYMLAALVSVQLLSGRGGQPVAADDFRSLLRAGGSQPTPALLADLGVYATAEGWQAAVEELVALLKIADGGTGTTR